MSDTVYIHSFKTKLGIIRTAATEKGLAIISLPGESTEQFYDRTKQYFCQATIERGGSINLEAEKQLKEFLTGNRKEFDLRLHLLNTPFQQKVLKTVARIPYGKTRTYGDIARAIGSPQAYRAVGAANAKNNLPLVIPCHRVVAAKGLGGYSGGLDMKKKLIMMESALESPFSKRHL